MSFDVFVSHWAGDADRVRPLVQALRDRGLRVWFDADAVERHASITRSVRDGVARSKLLVAYYSRTYPTRRACQWELTAAFTAAQREGWSPSDRILVINPERTAAGGFAMDHVHPIALRDAVFAPPPDAPEDPAAWQEEVERIAELVGELDGPLGAGRGEVPRQLGRRLIDAPGFVGRAAELWQVHSELSRSDAALITGARGGEVAQLAGMGGVGKSLLAEEYALRFGAAYPGGIFWLSASEADRAQTPLADAERTAARHTQLRTIATGLGVTVEGRGPAEIAAAIGVEIERAGRCLWVVDDVPPDLSDAQVREWLAPHPRARTLITTRGRRYRLAGQIDLDRLEPEDGYELLTSARRPATPEDEDAARRIVEDLGGHPLALSVAAHLLRLEAGMTSFAYVRAALAEPSRDELELAGQLRPELPNGHEASITATLLRSIDTLDEPARDVLRIASVLAAAPIPKAFLLFVLEEADELELGDAHRLVRDAVEQTYAVSLSDAVGGGDDGSMLVHALVSRTVRLSEPRPERHAELAAAVRDALMTWLSSADELPTHADRTMLSALVVHAREVAQRAQDDEATASEAVELLGAVAAFDRIRGDYGPAVAAQRAVVDAYEKRDDMEPHDVLAAMNNLAVMLQGQGDLPAAHELLERVLEATRQTAGEDDPNTLTAAGNLARVLLLRGELGRAQELQEQTLDALERVRGDEHPDTLSARGALASVLRARGDLPRARKLQEAVLDASTRVLGEEHTDVLTAANNLAGTLSDMGESSRARELHERVLEQQSRLGGPEHPETLRAMSNLAVVLRDTGELPRARKLQERALEASRRVLGASHPDTLGAMQNLIGIQRLQRDRDGAHELAREVLEQREALFGTDHPDTITALVNLVNVLHDGDRLGEARELAEQALERSRRVQGAEHPDTLMAMNALSSVMNDQRDLSAARALEEEELEVRRRVLGAEHPMTLVTMNNLGGTYYMQGDAARARELWAEALELARKALGPDHRHTLQIEKNLGRKPSPPRGVPSAPKPGRNAPCPCGSGKKYKHCCGA